MKKLFCFSVMLLLCVSACNTLEKNTFIVEGTTDLPNGKKIYRVVANTNGQPMRVDTTEVMNGKFELSGEVDRS